MAEDVTLTELLEEDMTPQEYFDAVKERKHHITDEDLKAVYDNCLDLLNKYKITGQVAGIKKLIFHLESIEREREIVKLGIDTFVYRDDIEYYIEKVADAAVKIINIENYEREIPDDIVNVISLVKDKFDQLYVVFTDYTGQVERQVEKERRAKDPILFGAFQDLKQRSVVDRFYYLGDWADEYCDLTLDKMVNETREKSGREITHTIQTPRDIEELKKQLGIYVRSETNTNFYIQTNQIEKSETGIFGKVRTFLNKKNESKH